MKSKKASKYAPIIIFLYNRPMHTEKMLEALFQNREAEQSPIYVFCDGAKDQEDQINVTKVRNILEKYISLHKDCNMNICISKTNNGLANSVIQGVTQVINQYERCIVLEDDLVVAKSFLNYMNRALDYYQNDMQIWSISGFVFPMKIKKYEHDIFYSRRASSWGWATWKNRWEKVDWDVKDYDAFCKSKKRQKKFNRGGEDLSKMLMSQMNHQINSWAIRWCYQQSKEEMYTIYPLKTKVLNIGCDGSGTHCGINNRIWMPLDENDIVFETIGLNNKIEKEFKRFYHISFLQRVIRKIKRIMKIE